MSSISTLVVKALITGSDALRAYKGKLPAKGTPGRILPSAVVQVIGGHDEVDLRGDAGLARRVVQIDAWHELEQTADDYMELVKTKLFGSGVFQVAGVTESGADPFDDEANLYRASREFTLWFNP